MFKVIEYYSRLQGARSELGGLPGWARLLIGIAAVPGIVLVALSVLALLVSILALLLLTMPLYRVLKALVRVPAEQMTGGSGIAFPGGLDSPGRKKVDATIIE